MKVHLQNVHENSWIELWILANISPKHSICGKSFAKSQRNYDCDSWGKFSTQLENLNKQIMGILARQRNYKCVSCFISRLSFKDKEIINVKILYSNDKSEDTFKMFHEEQKNF